MAGIAAGVKTAGEVNMQPRQASKMNRSLQSPATWTYIWVGGAFAYLALTYFGIMRVSRIGS
jgi:hypothetical protein